ncbi:hypothetical protein FB446DRAFT_387862 [Lentinula raphanica]|nr:hypothetical protein C8R42DRAFT_280046 [Lentinula raphanica]KAJ3775580.1 hypothetical protein FB446DRAFT_387862 [Lentinula raphanica]
MRLFTFIFSLVAVVLFMASAADAVAENSMEACNCPNNCDYTEGRECKYKRSVGIEDLTMSGTCQSNAYGALQCKDAKQVPRRRRRMVRARRREGSDIDD